MPSWKCMSQNIGCKQREPSEWNAQSVKDKCKRWSEWFSSLKRYKSTEVITDIFATTTLSQTRGENLEVISILTLKLGKPGIEVHTSYRWTGECAWWRRASCSWAGLPGTAQTPSSSGAGTPAAQCPSCPPWGKANKHFKLNFAGQKLNIMFSLVQLTQTFIKLTKTKTTKINTKGSRKNGLFTVRLTIKGRGQLPGPWP